MGFNFGNFTGFRILIKKLNIKDKTYVLSGLL